MLTITGKPVFKTVSIGPLAIFYRNTLSAKLCEADNAEAEIQRFCSARTAAVAQLKKLYADALRTVGEKDAAIFEVHQMMLEDDDFIISVEKHIRNEKLKAEVALEKSAREFSEMFRNMDDEYMQARSADVWDISQRVKRILCGESQADFSQYNQVILAADDLTPGEIMQLDAKKILGLVLSEGSTSSHTAILARNLGIATIVNTGVSVQESYVGKPAAIDGFTGTVYLDPDEKTLQAMQEKQGTVLAERRCLENMRGKESVTLDGQKIRIFANAGSLDDLPAVIAGDAEGIGLFRSEFLYLESGDYPTEEQQFAVYKKVLEAMAGKKVIVRTMDIGADKKADYFALEPEANPALGLRAIRICLTRPELFKTQLRALCRASVFGNLAIMFPMIISVDEVREAKAILAQVKDNLASEGVPCADTIETGIMIETPAAALISDELAKEVDFFSIGTNDLTQYTLAIDRQQKNLDKFFNPYHKSVLKLIEMSAKNAHSAGIRVGICGELGADLSLTESFLQMGIDELSVSAGCVLPLRAKVRSLDLGNLENTGTTAK